MAAFTTGGALWRKAKGPGEANGLTVAEVADDTFICKYAGF